MAPPEPACRRSVLGRCMDMPASLIDSEMPDTASPILVWASARCRWPSWSPSSCEGVTWSGASGPWRISFCSWPETWSCWGLEVGSWGSRAARRDRASRAGLVALAEGRLGLGLELVRTGLQLRGLQLDPLLGRGDVGDAPADLLEALQLLLVREVQGLPRILGLSSNLLVLAWTIPDRRFITAHSGNPSSNCGNWSLGPHRPVACAPCLSHAAS